MRAVYLAIFGFSLIPGRVREAAPYRSAEHFPALCHGTRGMPLKRDFASCLPNCLKLFRGRTLLLLTSETETKSHISVADRGVRQMGETVFTSRQLELLKREATSFLAGRLGGAVWRGSSRMSTISD